MLKVENIDVSYQIGEDIFTKGKKKHRVLEDFSLQVEEGEILGIVGESGSGKSTLANCIVGLKEIDSGKIYLEDREIFSIRNKKFKELDRSQVQMVFQNPYSSLNPKMKIRKMLSEILCKYKKLGKPQLEKELRKLLEMVSLSVEILDRFPRDLSGGQRQRVAIARALAADPKLLILDEPTSALDLIIQKSILELLIDLKREKNLTYIFISHDLQVVRYICDRIIIVERGKIVEEGKMKEVFDNPKESYTKKLINSIPKQHPLA